MMWNLKGGTKKCQKHDQIKMKKNHNIPIQLKWKYIHAQDYLSNQISNLGKS